MHLTVDAHEKLRMEGIRSRVVSLPSWEVFNGQSKEYRDHVLPPHIKARLAIEAGSPLGWRGFVGLEGEIISMESFGHSAPGKVLFEKFGFTQIDKMELPHKVWSECYRCPKFPNCDEVALIYQLETET